MRKNIRIERDRCDKIADHTIELVERKGVGHPDSLADGISERISQQLSNAYLDEFGAVAHHNTDEVQIIGGESKPSFAGGAVTEPIQVILAGRATREYQGTRIDVDGIAERAARSLLGDTVRNLDPDQHVSIESRIGEGSQDLTEMFFRESTVPLANDTSFGIGHAPFTPTEQLILELEEHLNGDGFKETMPAIGEDIKLMAYRDGDEILLTAGAAFVDRFVDDLDAYVSLKEELRTHMLDRAASVTDCDISLAINTADDVDKGSVYLTVTGTSAEMGDDGSTGRGNRVSGLITPKRSMSLEASSGKNPVSHIGKIYNILSHRIAEQIVEEHDVVDEATVKLLSQIGKPINEPQVADVRLNTQERISSRLEKRVSDTVDHWLERPAQVMKKVIDGEIRTF